MGQKSKLKAGAAGDKQGKPPRWVPERQGQAGDKEGKLPGGFLQGTVSRQPKRQAPSLPGKKLRPTAAPRVGHRRRAERMRSQADNYPPENAVMLQAG